eukprot:TRINITY_DN7080_c0_g1_i1.p1 TRINITY_DN7080_c0_g1~~TRINITY_DN7080_c0_g1_i1.p1  ORF type:complete len:171 (+),score=21.61 TRINITY_DN7080_c0_g1_i1:238-750(+)
MDTKEGEGDRSSTETLLDEMDNTFSRHSSARPSSGHSSSQPQRDDTVSEAERRLAPYHDPFVFPKATEVRGHLTYLNSCKTVAFFARNPSDRLAVRDALEESCSNMQDAEPTTTSHSPTHSNTTNNHQPDSVSSSQHTNNSAPPTTKTRSKKFRHVLRTGILHRHDPRIV